MREAIARTDYVSIAGSPLRFDARQQATPKIYVSVVRDGKRVIVEEIARWG